MWALRRVSSTSARVQMLNIATFRDCVGIGPLYRHKDVESSSYKHHVVDRRLKSQTRSFSVQFPNQFSAGKRSLSSQAGAKSGGAVEDDIEDGFSELETSEASKTAGEIDASDDSSSDSESDLSGDEESIEDTLESELGEDTEVDTKEGEYKKQKPSGLCKLILDETSPSISNALDKYAADGKDMTRAEIYNTLVQLRRFKLFGKALQLSEWLETNERLEFTERDYAARVDLIAKVRGPQKAENYIEKIPKSFRNELAYRTLLANYVSATNAKKAEEVFNKMKNLEFSLTSFSCNQLLLLYKRTDKKKISDVLLMMEKENIKPTLFTYQLLIDTKGQVNDIVGMDQIVETMKAEGIELDIRIQATLAKHYGYAGQKEKAEEILKEMEEKNLKANRRIYSTLLPIYADLGKVDDVQRIWEICEPNTRLHEYMAAINAWGKLKKVDKAEEIFNKMLEAKKKLSARNYSSMLKVYADNKMLTKGKALVKQMGESGCHIGPLTWDALVKLYVEAGEVEKADSVLHKAAEQNKQKPLFSSYMSILHHYAKRGDVHNSEKIFYRMRQVGYVSRVRPFISLLEAYIKAKAPAYGIRERMKADNVFPNKALAAQLSQVDAFKKTVVSHLLD